MSVYPLMIAAYLLGSVSFAVIVCRVGGWPDPRTVGSGNAGATNVMRVGGRWGGFLLALTPWAPSFSPSLVDSRAQTHARIVYWCYPGPVAR